MVPWFRGSWHIWADSVGPGMARAAVRDPLWNACPSNENRVLRLLGPLRQLIDKVALMEFPGYPGISQLRKLLLTNSLGGEIVALTWTIIR